MWLEVFLPLAFILLYNVVQPVCSRLQLLFKHSPLPYRACVQLLADLQATKRLHRAEVICCSSRKQACTHLMQAGCLHSAAALMEVQHSVIPAKAAVLKELPACPLGITHQALVRHMQHLARQDLIPQLHQVVVETDLLCNVCRQDTTVCR